MLDLLLVLVFALHILAVGVATSGPLLCVWLEWRLTRRGDQSAGALGERLAWLSVWAGLAGGLLGGLSLLLVWCEAPESDNTVIEALLSVPGRYIWWGVPDRLWYGLAEWLFYLVCMVAYAALWQRLARHRIWHRLLVLLAASNLIYHFPPLFAVVSVIAGSKTALAEPLSRQAFFAMMGGADVLSRVTHYLIAALAIGGVVCMALAQRLPRGDTARTPSSAWGARLALAAAVLQIPSGIYLLICLPQGYQQRLMGGDMTATLSFAAAVVASLTMLHYLAAMALGDDTWQTTCRAAGLLVLVVVLMSGARHAARRIVHEPAETSSLGVGAEEHGLERGSQIGG